MIEHSISVQLSNMNFVRSGDINGTLVGVDGKVMTEFTPQRRKESGVAGDVLPLRILLAAANTSLDGIASMTCP
jgi:hypothetical protein